MLHIWTKNAPPAHPNKPAKRPTVAVIDNDDALRRAALRALRSTNVAGIGLIETAAAFRMIASSEPAVVIVDSARVPDLLRAVADFPFARRPRVIAIARGAHTRVEGAHAVIAAPLDADELLSAVARLLHEAPTGRRKRVLLVDDDHEMRDVCSVLLEDAGYDVVPAPHGRAAWNALEAGLRPDVILLDMAMPVMNGEQMFARLSESTHAETPVVVMTASAVPAMPRAAVLKKPFLASALLDAVARAGT